MIGCTYNAPAAYAPGVFLSCEGDLQDEVGTYTSNGASKSSKCVEVVTTAHPTSSAYTWSQPSSLPASSTLPWTPRIPASSNCVTYQSTDVFPLSNLGYQSTAGASAAGSSSSSATAMTGTASPAGASGASGASSRSGSSSGAASTAVAAAATGSKSGASLGVVAHVGLVLSAVVGVVALLA